MQILNSPIPSWKSIKLEDTMKRDRDNGAYVSPDREVFHISSSYRVGTRTIEGTTHLEDNISDVWDDRVYTRPEAGEAVVDLRQEGWKGVKRTGIGLGVGTLAGTLIGAIANPYNAGTFACSLIGGALGAGLGFYNFDGALGTDRAEFRCKTPVQAFTLANKIEDLAKQIATAKAAS